VILISYFAIFVRVWGESIKLRVIWGPADHVDALFSSDGKQHFDQILDFNQK
jgi:hypothetical protein